MIWFKNRQVAVLPPLQDGFCQQFKVTMIRLGAPSADMHEMNSNDVFMSRLKLLIVMSSAYLKQFPLGDFRKKAIIQNANRIAGDLVDWPGQVRNFRGDQAFRGDPDVEHIFFQRVKLLAVMAKAVAEDHPMGYHRLKAMEDNLIFICEAIRFNRQLWEKGFLKVA